MLNLIKTAHNVRVRSVANRFTIGGNGIEIIRRLLISKSLKLSRGTIVAELLVNVYGMFNQSRLPYRRD